MNDTLMTIVGNVVDAPRLRRTRNGHSVANFRVASTPRRFDREKNAWIDCDTLFVSITCWRALAENVGQSLFRGQPVVLTGRYYQREYKQNEVLRTAYELEATSVGHDLTRGVSSFQKVARPSLAVQIEVDDEGRPIDQSEHYLELIDEDHDAELGPDGDTAFAIDRATGEMRELAPAG